LSDLTAALATASHWFTYPNIKPVAFQIGIFSVRWYGITYLIGAMLVYLQMQRAGSRARTGLTVDQAQEFVVYAMIGVVLGGRLFFLLADVLTPVSAGGNPLSHYLQNPLEIIAIWHGGMAFHGGLIGAIVGMLLFVRRNKLAFYPIADEAALWIPVAIALTRCANFINGELPGRLTASPIGIMFPDYPGGAVRRRDGQVMWAFIAGYGLVRTIVEFYREPGIVFLGLTGAQYLTIAMFILGVVMYWHVSRPRPITSASGRVRAAHD
jgi:phosphatidylglycerol---prolipoprotein diacylglyceryl transferase